MLVRVLPTSTCHRPAEWRQAPPESAVRRVGQWPVSLDQFLGLTDASRRHPLRQPRRQPVMMARHSAAHTLLERQNGVLPTSTCHRPAEWRQAPPESAVRRVGQWPVSLDQFLGLTDASRRHPLRQPRRQPVMMARHSAAHTLLERQNGVLPTSTCHRPAEWRQAPPESAVRRVGQWPVSLDQFLGLTDASRRHPLRQPRRQPVMMARHSAAHTLLERTNKAL